MASKTASYRTPIGKWSRHDPVNMPLGPTEHWSLMRVRATEVADDARAREGGRQTTRNAVTTRLPQLTNLPAIATPGRQAAARPLTSGGRIFSDRPTFYSLDTSHMQLLGVRRPSARQQTAYSVRAKDDFKYWYQERPKPTSFGKYGIGSYKTLLGLGNAPRT